MAVYRTTDTELTSIANAIRAKTGGSSSLVYPTGFVSAINSISTSDSSASSSNLILKDANGDTTSTSAILSDITLGTKSVTPTSSAQIITPETGLDGYHTINVGAMPAYNYMGENAIFVQNLYEEEITLDDTSFSTWTPSTTTTTILSEQNLTQVYLPVQYDYILKMTGHVKYVYTEEITSAAMTHMYTIGYLCFGQRPSNANDFITSNYNYITYAPAMQNYFMLYYTTRSVYELTNNNYGILISMLSPSFSNQSSSETFGLTTKTPRIRAVSNSSYMSNDAFSLLDTTNTKIYIKLDLYRCETKNDYLHKMLEEMITMHTTLYPQT